MGCFEKLVSSSAGRRLQLLICFLVLIVSFTLDPVLTEDCPELWLDCGNGRCIANIWRCDNDNDCGNMRDEEGCDIPPELKCLSSQFPCVEDHHCIPNTWFCDGDEDCKDGSDEKNCDNSTENCGFRCHSNHCIPARWQCDGEKDCDDGSDEEGCMADQGMVCPESDFTCSSGTCLKKSLVCDGKKDCPGGEDEGNHCGDACDNSTCQHQCRSTPTGAECYCNSGFELQKDGRKCSDINECLTDGFCSHICKNTDGGYNCSCFDGYFLDNRTCLAKGPEPLLVFATPQEIRGMLLRTQKYFPIHKSVSRASAMDVDPSNSRLYWTDLSSQGSAVYSVNIDGSGFETVISNGLLVPEDVAVDWVARNLYITDSGMKQVLVCKIDGAHCGVLHHDKVDKPRSLALDIPEGLMYWTDWGQNPGIFRSGMDGTRRLTLVSTEIRWPNGIALDHTTNRLYWCDAQTYRIEYITLDGKTRKVVLEERMFHPYSLAVFEDTLYWTDWSKFSVDSCSKFTGHKQQLLTRENGKHIMGIHVYHPVLERNVPNPCWSALCSHLCVLSSFGQHRCLCPPGFYLASDKVTCKIDWKSVQLFVTDGGFLHHVQPEAAGNRPVTPIPVKAVDSIGDIAYDQRRNTIFFSDTDKNVIYSVNGSSFSQSEVIRSHLLSVEGLDYDWMGDNLYWTDFGKGTVEVFSLSTHERIVVLSGLPKPLALAISPEKGLMFVSMVGARPHVSMFDMDGHNEKELKSLTGLAMSLALDPVESKIYYADPRSGIIASVDYLNPKESRVVHKHELDHVASVAVSQKFLYWMTTKSDRLYRMERNDSRTIIHSIPLESNNRTAVRKVKYIRSTQGLESSCSRDNGGCSHVCLVNPSGHSCACPVAFHLGNDLKQCEAVSQCSPTEVHCARGSFCIPQSWVCDGSPDCDDGSDEENCRETEACPKEDFQCKNGRCISSLWHCDSADDCGDGSDEDLCPKASPCQDHEFDCENGRCIPPLWRCDGEKDCNNSKDEEDCHLTMCKPDQLRCDHGLCIPSVWKCDGSNDCLDDTDERDCPVTARTCTKNEFQCQNGICVDMALLCDHRNDCQDNSDEQSCVYNTTCNEGMFRCDDGLCIYDHEICDHRNDCEDGEDESNCTETECGSEFYCSATKRCIPRKWLCDGDDDCGDAADEHLNTCSEIVTEAVANETDCEFSCSTGECLPWAEVCNGIPDCMDYSDEGNLCASSCGKNNGGCSHLCFPTPAGSRCSCLNGFELQQDTKTCEDVNECLLPGSCSQFCNNTKGSFKCSCGKGYFLTNDHKKCKAVGGSATLMYLLPNQIRGIDLTSLSHNVYVSGQWSDIRGMDYDASSGTLFWSEWREGTISSSTPGSSSNDVILHDLHRPYFVRWDWIGKNIYFTNAKALIRACSRNGTYCTTVVDTGLPHINSLELDPGSGLMFWTVWSIVLKTGSGIIERANMDGSGRITIVHHKVHWPSSLAVDHVMKRLYWADVKLNVIECTDFNGLDRRTILHETQYPYSIALFEDSIYWSDWVTDTMMHCNRLTGEACSQLHAGDVKADIIMVVHKVQQPAEISPCRNRCPQMCLLKPLKGYSCVCSEKFFANNSDCLEISASTKLPRSQKPAEECVEGFCLNGADCVVVGGERICRCPYPYTGERCDEAYEGVKLGHTGDYSWIVAVVFGLFLVAALLLLVLLCRRNKEKLRKLSENVAVSFRNPMFPLRKSGRLVMDTDDPGCDELMLGQKGDYRASGFGNPLFGQQEQTPTDPEHCTGEFKRWSSYDSQDSAFVSEYQAKGDSTLNIDQEALVDAPKRGDKLLQFFRKL